MKKSQGLKGDNTRSSALDALERRFTGKEPEDPRRANYPRRLQSIYFPPKGKK